MNFNCDACQKLYSIADEKVQGRGFRVTCKQCGHVIVVKAGGPAPVRTAPAPAASSVPTAGATSSSRDLPPAPLFPPLPGDVSPPPPDAADLRHAGHANDSASAAPRPQEDEHEHFFNSAPTHRPRVTAEWLLASKRRHPALFVSVIGLALLLVAGGVGLSLRDAAPRRADPPPAPLAARAEAPPAPAPTVMPALAVKAEPPAPAPEPPPAELPPEPPLPQKGALAPRGAGGRAGFESVGGGEGDDGRDRLRKTSLTIGKKDRRLLDLLGKKGDAAPAAVERTELDTGRGSLDEVAVRQVLASNGNGFAACVTRAVKADPHLKVNDRRATLNLTIKPSGVVSSAWVSEADLDKSPLGTCLLGTARRMVFPAFSGEEVEVAAPLSLSTTY